MKKLVIFDLDGTLLNTIADLAHSTNYALNKLGYPTHEIEKYNFMVGNGIDKLFERALPEEEKSKENVLRVRKEFVPYYDIHNADDSRPYPGIPELLSYLQNAGVQIAGTPTPSGGYSSQAIALAQKYMSRYPGYTKYDYHTSSGNYIRRGNYLRWNRSTLSDPDGYMNMTADQILADLFS